MSLSTHEAFDIIAGCRVPKRDKPHRRTYQHASTVPFVDEDAGPRGCHVEFDYSYEIEDGDMPMVNIEAARFVGNDGTEYPVKLASLDGRYLAEVESLIGDEIVTDYEARNEP